MGFYKRVTDGDHVPGFVEKDILNLIVEDLVILWTDLEITM